MPFPDGPLPPSRNCPPPPRRRRCFAGNSQLERCSGESVAIERLTVGDSVKCVRRTSLDQNASFEVSCCDVVAWGHIEPGKHDAFTLTYQVDGKQRELSASPRHAAYLYKGSRTATSASIKFSREAFHTVMFQDVREGDLIGIYTGKADGLTLVTVDGVHNKEVEGAYVAMLEDGGSPIIESALMSMHSLVELPEIDVLRKMHHTFYLLCSSHLCCAKSI